MSDVQQAMYLSEQAIYLVRAPVVLFAQTRVRAAYGP